MAIEIAVKAAAGAPDVLGDCELTFLLPFFLRFSFWVLIQFLLIRKIFVFGLIDRPFLPKGSSNIGREESNLQVSPHHSQRQTQMVFFYVLNF